MANAHGFPSFFAALLPSQQKLYVAGWRPGSTWASPQGTRGGGNVPEEGGNKRELAKRAEPPEEIWLVCVCVWLWDGITGSVWQPFRSPSPCLNGNGRTWRSRLAEWKGRAEDGLRDERMKQINATSWVLLLSMPIVTSRPQFTHHTHTQSKMPTHTHTFAHETLSGCFYSV